VEIIKQQQHQDRSTGVMVIEPGGQVSREHQVQSGHSARVKCLWPRSRSLRLNPGPPKHASINRSEHRVFTPRTQPSPPSPPTALAGSAAATAAAFMSWNQQRSPPGLYSLGYRQPLLPACQYFHAAVYCRCGATAFVPGREIFQPRLRASVHPSHYPT
jgi:hypothetical protein